MTEPNPPRRPLATFLRTPAPVDATHVDAGPDAARVADVPDVPTAHGQALQDVPVEPLDSTATDAAHDAAEALGDPAVLEHVGHTAQADAVSVPPSPTEEAPRDSVVPLDEGTDVETESQAPSFLGPAPARLRAPRWQWGAVAALAVLLLVQMAVADRDRLAADAGTRPLIGSLCSVLRCSLPAWHEPSAFTMTSRDIRPVPGQPGSLQVQASIRNDARWAQAWPSLRLSLSDADGRVIGTGVFTPQQYLGGAASDGVLDPGQSARIAFRVREPAASTVAFTFDFL